MRWEITYVKSVLVTNKMEPGVLDMWPFSGSSNKLRLNQLKIKFSNENELKQWNYE